MTRRAIPRKLPLPLLPGGARGRRGALVDVFQVPSASSLHPVFILRFSAEIPCFVSLSSLKLYKQVVALEGKPLPRLLHHQPHPTPGVCLTTLLCCSAQEGHAFLIFTLDVFFSPQKGAHRAYFDYSSLTHSLTESCAGRSRYS